MRRVATATRTTARRWRDYRTVTGARPVKAYLDDLTDEEVAAIIAGMKEVAQLGLVASRHLRGDIYEVRADARTRSFRLLFSNEGRSGRILLSLSVFEKRTQKAPSRELELAERRLSDWRARGTRGRLARQPRRS
jgi:phage-related protein